MLWRQKEHRDDEEDKDKPLSAWGHQSRCGSVGKATKLDVGEPKKGKRPARIGLWKCNERECRKQFTVKVGTVFEHGRIPLHKVLQAVFLLCCSKKGCSSHQLHRILQITYKSAWFLSHRIREAMRDGLLAPMGGLGGIVEIDETIIGKLKGAPYPRDTVDNRNQKVSDEPQTQRSD